MLRRALALGAMLSGVVAGAASCSDSNDDPVGRACRVIVQDCHVMSNEGDCIDLVGELTVSEPDCVACIGAGGCNYFSECQRAVAGCRLPTDIQP